MACIEVNNVGKQFRLGGQTITALQDVSFEVGERQFVSLIGPSGCGKSTILRLVADLIKPSGGEIRVKGLNPAQARQQRMYAFVFQDPVMFPWRNIIKNVELPLEIVDRETRQRFMKRPLDLLKLVGLQGFEKAQPAQLSGGMRHRAAIARALLLGPPVLLMDEPFGALDEITRDRMNMELLRIWSETDAAVLFVTHSIEEAVFLSDRVLVLSTRPGTVVADVPIDLPRPRALDVKQGERFFDLCSGIRRTLAQTTAAAMALQEGEG